MAKEMRAAVYLGLEKLNCVLFQSLNRLLVSF